MKKKKKRAFYFILTAILKLLKLLRNGIVLQWNKPNSPISVISTGEKLKGLFKQTLTFSSPTCLCWELPATSCEVSALPADTEGHRCRTAQQILCPAARWERSGCLFFPTGFPLSFLLIDLLCFATRWSSARKAVVLPPITTQHIKIYLKVFCTYSVASRRMLC